MKKSKKQAVAVPGEIKIEKGIEVPPRTRRGIYPWREMEVGDSFLCPPRGQRTVSTATSWAGRKLGKSFTVRKTSKGYRVWRVE